MNINARVEFGRGKFELLGSHVRWRSDQCSSNGFLAANRFVIKNARYTEVNNVRAFVA